ncbi:MAG: tricarboxylate transporter [Betaproteobacteria bacterium]|nr:tricarboxylate transporter [Betaproteobacteria bacterium]
MDKLVSFKAAACFGLAVSLALIPATRAAAQNVDFGGKRIEVVVPFAPGGGSDVYIRALAPFLEKHLPGNPTIIVRNIPGAGGIPGANQFQARAKADGTEVIVVSSSTVSNFVFQKSKVQYDLNKWEPVLLSPQGTVVYASPSLGVSGPKDLPRLKDKALVFGGQCANCAELRTIVTLELLGLKANYVWGLNRGPVRLAFERGEMNINYDTAPGYLKNASQLVKAGKAVPLYSLGIINDTGAVVRDPNFSDLPNFLEAYELMHGKKPSGDGYDAWKALLKMGVMANKALMLPAGTPKPVVEAWRVAIRKVLDDPEFDKVAGKVIEGYPQFIGEAARPIIKDATTFSAASWDWIKTYLKTTHNVTIQ